MSAYAFLNLVTPINIASGVSDYIYFAPMRDFDVDGIKCPTAPFTNPGDKVKITEAHVFLADKAFAKIQLAPEKNQLTVKTIGDKGFNKFEFEYDIFMAGSYAEVHEFAMEALNVPMIAMGKDANCGADLYYQLGCDCLGAYMTFDFTTGTTKDGNKGYAGKITYTGSSVLLYTVAGGPEVLGN